MGEIDIDKEVEEIRKQRAKLASQREAEAKGLSIEQEVEDIRKQKAALAQQPELEEPETAQPEPEVEQPQLKDSRVYVVQPGDNLSMIAQEVYGNANRWREIFEANKDQIKDPSLIRPGQKLQIR